MSKILNLNKKVKPELTYTAKSDSIAEIVLYGQIGDDSWDDTAISATSFHKILKDLPSNTKEIHLRINSPGGSVFDGITIYERLRQHSAKVVVFVDGVAASIASVIALAGDEIHIGNGAFFMIHRPMAGAHGNTSELERTIEILDKIERQMTAIYAKKTSMSTTEITQMLTGDYWIDADMALEMGFADTKTEGEENFAAVASMIDNSSLKSRPNGYKDANQIAKERVLEIQNNMKGFLARD
tara:strand:- start:5097 stop:5819 length:723 start_codon:yes stop_codon:yes gene_type:complete